MTVEGFVFPRGFASKFCLGRALGQNIPSGVWTQVLYDTIIYDILDECRVAPNSDFIPKQSGYYWIVGRMRFTALPINTVVQANIDINGGNYGEVLNRCGVGNKNLTGECTIMRFLNAGDVVTFEVHQNSGFLQNHGGHVTSTTLLGFRIG